MPAKKTPKKRKAPRSDTAGHKEPAPKIAARAGSVLRAAKFRTAVSTEVEVPYLPAARKFVRRTNIHRRRIIPRVPMGEQLADAAPTAALSFYAPRHIPARRAAEALARKAVAGPPLAATDNIALVRNVQLDDVATADTASHVCEPSVATNGNVVFYTGNWFAAVSLDGGQTFQFVDPAHSFPDPPGMQFCCDQVVHYIKKIDTFVWLLQYDASVANLQRLAFATTAEVRQGRWRLFDITPQSLGLPGVFLDFPDLAVGSNMLYVTTNGFVGEDWVATVLVRIPLAGIRTGNITAQRTISRVNFNFRVAQHCRRRAFWASHNTTSNLRVFFWDEGEAQPSFADVNVPTWSEGPYVSFTPDNRNWLNRADPRILGATKVGSELWFAWGSAAGGVNSRPHPFVQIARINANNFNLIQSINLWDPNSAICYAALTTNSGREVGVSYMIGGGTRFPTHVVGMLTGTRRDVTTFTSARGPIDRKWGDYLTIRRHYPNQRLFAATGYTLQSGSGRSDATPNFTIFGRTGEVS